MSNEVTTEKTVRAEASDRKRGMTLDELARFVQQAHREEVPGDTTVRIVSTWRGSIRRAEIKG